MDMLKLGPYGKNKIMCRKEILYGEVILLYHYCKKFLFTCMTIFLVMQAMLRGGHEGRRRGGV